MKTAEEQAKQPLHLNGWRKFIEQIQLKAMKKGIDDAITVVTKQQELQIFDSEIKEAIIENLKVLRDSKQSLK